jgi:hypothetical protein
MTRMVHVALGLVVAVVGIVLTVMSLTGLDYLGPNDEPGPGFFPALVSGILAALGLCLALVWLLSPRAQRDELPTLSLVPAQMARVGVVWAGLAGFAAVIEPLGFIVAGELFVLFLIVVVDRVRSWRLILVLLALTPATYFLFATLLDGQLPGGTLWA